MPSTATSALLRARLTALVDSLPAARGGDEPAVHQARVASRRLREFLPVAGADAGHAARRALKHVRKVTRALGPAREIDVALLHLAEFEQQGASPKSAIALVRRDLERERRARRAAMLDALSPVALEKLKKRVAPFERTSHDAGAGDAGLAEAARRVGHRARRLKQAIATAGAMYLADRLHAVRVEVKKLRYALEVQRDLTRSRVSARIRQLKDAQELLGRLHDLEVLIERTRTVQAKAAARDRRNASDLDPLIRALEGECRELHAAYMGRRDELLRLCDALTSSAPARKRARVAA